MTVNADDYFGTATAPAADAPRKRSTNPDDYFGKVPEPVAPQKGTIERVREAVGNASDPAQRPAGERRGGTRSEAPAPYGAGDKRVEPPTGNVLDKAPAEQPPGQPLIEQRGAPISDEAASAIKRSVGAMPTSEAPRPFSHEALKSATELLAGMSPEQRANQLARTDLPKWMRSAMQAAARNLVPCTLELGGKNPALFAPDGAVNATFPADWTKEEAAANSVTYTMGDGEGAHVTVTAEALSDVTAHTN